MLEKSKFSKLGKRVRVPDDPVLEEKPISFLAQIIVKKSGSNSV